MNEENDILKERIRQLEDRIADLTGRSDITAARLTLRLTHVEAVLFVLLVQRGVATYEHVEQSIYSTEQLEDLESVNLALRSHVKRVRRKASAHGIEIQTVYGFGYEMAAESRLKAKRLFKTWRDQLNGV